VNELKITFFDKFSVQVKRKIKSDQRKCWFFFLLDCFHWIFQRTKN